MCMFVLTVETCLAGEHAGSVQRADRDSGEVRLAV